MIVYVKTDEGKFTGEVYAPEVVNQVKLEYLDIARKRIQGYIDNIVMEDINEAQEDLKRATDDDTKKVLEDSLEHYNKQLHRLQNILTKEPKDIVVFYLDWVDIRFVPCEVCCE